jgi:hypothetical protein
VNGITDEISVNAREGDIKMLIAVEEQKYRDLLNKTKVLNKRLQLLQRCLCCKHRDDPMCIYRATGGLWPCDKFDRIEREELT